MSIYLIGAVAWLGFAVLGWSWLVVAARADRPRSAPPPQPRSRARS